MTDSTKPAALAERLDFTLLDEAALEAIRAIEPAILKHLPEALARFYERLAREPSVARFFGDAAQMERAKSAQQGHWSTLAAGRLDSAYFEASNRIGTRHARIGLEPRWYVGGYALILDAVIEGVIKDALAPHAPARGFLQSHGRERAAYAAMTEGLAKSLGSLLKAVMLDIDIAVSTYFDQLTATAAAEQQRSRDKIALAVTTTGEVLRQLAEGDLTGRVKAELAPELEQIKHDTNSVADRLTAIMTRLRQTSGSLRTATGEILAGANDLSDRTTRQASSVEQTSASLEQIAGLVSDNAVRATSVAQQIEAVRSLSEESGEVMGRATAAMERIDSSSSRISGIVGLIDDIAFQTNLLALNASVEAARAGEVGKGFAVVAVEVRRLAQSAAAASRDIKDLIEASASEVRAGTALVASVGDKLAGIVDGIRQCNALTAEMADSSQSQSAAIREVHLAIRDIDQSTQHNAALVEETNAAIEQTEAQVAEIDGIVDLFRLDTELEKIGRRDVA